MHSVPGKTAVIVILIAVLLSRQQFPVEESGDLVDKRWLTAHDTMVTQRKTDLKAKRYSAGGTGKQKLKILYQNGGNYDNTFDNLMRDIELMLNQNQPHVFYMAENRMDERTKSRLENRHGFCVETLGARERVWAAVQSKVPYKRRLDLEQRGIAALWLEFGSGSSKYLVVGVYREYTRLGGGRIQRSTENQKKRWSQLMKHVNQVIHDTGQEVHILGDMNMDTLRWAQLGWRSGFEKQWAVDMLYEELINGAGMVLSEPQGYTWTSRDGTKSSCLDIHLTNKPEHLGNVEIKNDFTGDHCTLIVERIDKSLQGPTRVTKRNWGQVDYVWMAQCFYEYWYWPVHYEMLPKEDPDEVAERVICILNVMADSRWPVKNFQIKPNYSPYVTRNMRMVRRRKIRLWKQWKKTGSMETYKEMRRVTNRLRTDTKRARRRYIGKKMSDYTDSQGLWKFAKDEADWKNVDVPSIIIKDGVRLTDPAQVANALNDELIKKTKDILRDIPDDGVDPLSYTREWLADKVVPVVELTKPASQEEVEAAMADLSITDAAGHDNLTSRLIKSMRKPLSCLMTHMVNTSFKADKMPDVFKLAKISPLYKKGDRFKATNYRPVAVLPSMSKIIEKVVIGRLRNHLESNGLLSDNQNAYRAHRSVTTAVLQLYDSILKCQEKAVDSACIFLDCSAAFDTIQHDVLIGKLKLYGVDEKGIRWMKSYLSDRAQYVSVGGTRSEIKRILDGTFQGSIGGPQLFLIMINDIVILCKAGQFVIFIYADDTCLRCSLTGDTEKDQAELDRILKEIVRYMNATKLKFNFSKSEFVVCAPKKHADHKDLVLNLDGTVVKQQLHARLLGLQVSWNLTHTWYVSEMKDNLIASLNKRLFILRKLAPLCPKRCVKNLAHGLIYSKLIFGIQYWSRPLPEPLWSKIEVILNHAARVVLKIRNPLKMHVKDLYRVINWLPADACRDFHDLSLFWSIKHHKTPRDLSTMFTSHSEQIDVENTDRRVTRSVSQGGINRTEENDSRHHTLRAASFVPRMVRTFNALHEDYKRLPDLRDKWGNPLSNEVKFISLKSDLRNMCQWRDLGPPSEWPETRADAMLDRSYELAGLGIISEDSESESDVEVERAGQNTTT